MALATILSKKMNNYPLFQYYSSFDIPTHLKQDILNQDLSIVDCINNTTKINLFVGVNNSGKSLLLREILKSDNHANKPSNKIKEDINNFLLEKINRLLQILKENNYERLVVNHQTYIDNERIKKSQVPFDSNFETVTAYRQKGLEDLFRLSKQKPARYRQVGGLNASVPFPKFIENEIHTIQDDIRSFIANIEDTHTNRNKINKVYIPTIRSLRKYEKDNFLSSKTKTEYKLDPSIIVQNGQQLYSNIEEMITDSYEIQQRKKEYEVFISQEFFPGQKITITPHRKLNELTLKIGEERERPIYNLGEGLQMMLVLTFPIFFYESGIITIEEPETFLHPGFQHKLIDTYLNNPRSKDFIFFISTHSNHILDSINYHNDISVYSMKKKLNSQKSNSESKFILSELSNPDSGLLRTLGVRNTSVFLSNSTIWVEGVTDMLYLRKYLCLYIDSLNESSHQSISKNFSEGIHYSFILSGGSSIIHYDFSDDSSINELKEKVVTKNICGKSYVIVDNDGNKNKARKREFFRELKGRFKVLPVIEIENLLSNEVIQSTIRSFPTCSNILFDESNSLTESEYANIRIGTYIEDHLLKNDTTKKRKHFKENAKSNNTTINCKMEFCKKALNHITIDNMTQKSKNLASDIVNFIIDKNSNISN